MDSKFISEDLAYEVRFLNLHLLEVASIYKEPMAAFMGHKPDSQVSNLRDIKTALQVSYA
jgi:hypothetical protein